MTDAAWPDPPPRPGPQVFWEWLAVALAAVALVLLLTFTGATKAGDNLVYDPLLRLHGRAPSDQIVVVAIDDASLAAYGAWPWPRALHARLLDRLTDAGAAAVGYDVLFIEPDPAGGDAALATALRRSGRAALPVLELSPGDDGQAVKMVRPRAPLATSAARLGQVSLILDGDGVARRFSVLQASGGVCWRHLAPALLDIARQGSAAFPNCVPLAQASRHVDGLIATPPQLIPFVGPPNSFRTVSAADLLRGEVPPELIKGRLVLVGATAAGLGDRHMTAAAGGKGAMAGVEIQANILDALMQNVTLITLPNWLIALVSLAPVTGFMAALLWLKPSSNLIVGGGLLALVFAGSAAGFLSGVWFPPLSAAAGLLLAYPLWSWRRLAAASDYLREEISRFDNPVATSPERLPTDALGRQVDVLSRAADQLRSLSRVLGRALQSLPDAAVLVDGDGAITLANAHAESLAGAGAGRLAGSSVRAWLELAVGGVEGARIASALTGESTTLEVTSLYGIEYEASWAGLAGADEKAGVILRLADITAIRSVMRQREEALQLLTHDIRAPLTSILAVLQTDAGTAAGESMRIDAHVRRALALADGYIQLARAESYRYRPEQVDLGQVMLDAADEIWPQAQQKSIALKTDAVADDLIVNGDPSLIARAIVNVLDNAVKHSPEGSTITLSSKAQGGEILCTVDDEGPGMDQAEAEALFQSFRRGGARNRSGGGVGLGLAVVLTVMKRHGGEAAVSPAPTGGARITLRFPAAHREDAG